MYGPTAVVALVGAVMLVVGAVIPFNVAEGEDRIVSELGWLAADPIATAIGVVVAVGLLFARRRALAAGLLIAFGICSALLWVRYVGIPLAQWSADETKASPQAGGFRRPCGRSARLLRGLAACRGAQRRRSRSDAATDVARGRVARPRARHAY